MKGKYLKPLPKKQLNDLWEDLRLYPKDAFGFGEPYQPFPKPEDAGFVAARMGDMAKNQPIHGYPASRQFVAEIVPRVRSPHLARAMLGALLCQWLIFSPETMCAGDYSNKERKRYEAELFTRELATTRNRYINANKSAGVAEEVQHIERLSMRSLFADESFQRTKFKERANLLLLSLKLALIQIRPDAPGFDDLNSPEEWAQRAVMLKQKLMLDPKDYRIRYCMPGCRFNPSWMMAEDKDCFPLENAKAKGRKVVTCLFPSLSQHESPPLPEKPTLDTLDSLMVVNKKFFPNFEEKQAFTSNWQTVVSKAVVLVS